jgi:hypothetical protein
MHAVIWHGGQGISSRCRWSSCICMSATAAAYRACWLRQLSGDQAAGQPASGLLHKLKHVSKQPHQVTPSQHAPGVVQCSSCVLPTRAMLQLLLCVRCVRFKRSGSSSAACTWTRDEMAV